MQKTIQETRKPAPGAPITRGRQQAVKPKSAEEVALDQDAAHEAEMERVEEAANSIVKLAVSRLQALSPEEPVGFSTLIEIEGRHYRVNVSLATPEAFDLEEAPSVLSVGKSQANPATTTSIGEVAAPVGESAPASPVPSDIEIPSPVVGAEIVETSPAGESGKSSMTSVPSESAVSAPDKKDADGGLS